MSFWFCVIIIINILLDVCCMSGVNTIVSCSEVVLSFSRPQHTHTLSSSPVLSRQWLGVLHILLKSDAFHLEIVSDSIRSGFSPTRLCPHPFRCYLQVWGVIGTSYQLAINGRFPQLPPWGLLICQSGSQTLEKCLHMFTSLSLRILQGYRRKLDEEVW